MRGREIIKEVMDLQGVPNADMARRLGISQAALWDRLNNKKVKDIPVSLLHEMLMVLDYKILVVPAKTRVPSDSFVANGATEPTPPKVKPDLDKLLSDDTPRPKSSNQKIKLT